MVEKKSRNSRAHLTLHGKVQNVGLRFFVQRKASACGLRGWVKNSDSCVEIIFEGDKGKIEDCIKVCRKGPVFSKVEKVDVKWEKPAEKFTRFEVR
ncbi:MAG: acylphosphatase [Patescibacteria group bacterium]|nr:MAG: acylphosphatase [Patescibacteria group bacterium]